jgi:replicative DNA helicase
VTPIIAFVAALARSYQPLIVKSFDIDSRKAVSIGDIGNELFSESPVGARSLSSVELAAPGARCPVLLGSTHFVALCVSRHAFVRLHRHRWEIMAPLDSTARKQAPEPATAYRMAPHNIEAEQALLGAVLVNNEALYRVSDFLEPVHFFEPIHQQIYDHARSLIRTGKLASPITLKTFLPADIDIAGLTVAQYLARLAAEATTIINAADYGRAVYDLAIRRDLIGIGEDMVNMAFDAPVDFAPREQIEDAERRLYELAEIGRYGGGFQRFETALTTALEMAAHAYQRDGKLSGLATELKDLDSKMGGLQKSDLIIVAGRPGMGKTALATNIAYNVARGWRGEVRPDGHIQTANGGIVGFFSLEMSAEQLATRIIAEQTGIPSSTIRRGAIDQRGFDKLKDVTVELQHLPLFIDETGGLNIAQLAARARRLKRQKGLDLLVIDYIQLLQGSSRRGQENRVQEVTEITTNLKALAKELNVPIMALSQLSRQVENRDDKRPQLSDLRESGSIEQDADVVLFVFREEYYLSNKEPRPGTDDHIKWQTEMDAAHGKAEIIIGKQRHGPTGTVNLQFDAAVTRFDNLARDDQALQQH